MKTTTGSLLTTGKHPEKSTPFAKLADKLKTFFEPEEVEVTFKVADGRVTYTYTKVAPHTPERI